MTPWIEAAAAKYGAIGIGLIVGTGAKYGLTLAEGRKITYRLFIIDVLLIGMIALIASNVCERAGIAGNAAAMVSALFAISSDRVLRMVREKFLRRVDDEFRTLVDEHRGELRNEIQAEMSAKGLIEDQLAGRAPDEYEALKPRPMDPGQ